MQTQTKEKNKNPSFPKLKQQMSYFLLKHICQNETQLLQRWQGNTNMNQKQDQSYLKEVLMKKTQSQ